MDRHDYDAVRLAIAIVWPIVTFAIGLWMGSWMF